MVLPTDGVPQAVDGGQNIVLLAEAGAAASVGVVDVLLFWALVVCRKDEASDDSGGVPAARGGPTWSLMDGINSWHDKIIRLAASTTKRCILTNRTWA